MEVVFDRKEAMFCVVLEGAEDAERVLMLCVEVGAVANDGRVLVQLPLRGKVLLKREELRLRLAETAAERAAQPVVQVKYGRRTP